MIRKDSIVPASRVNRKELILSTILKVYAIRGEVEERAEESRLSNLPLLGGLALRLSSPSLSKSQHRDAAAFVTATCTTNESLVLMEQVTGFKANTKVQRPSKVWLSYAGLVLPLLIAIMAEAYMYYVGVLAQMPYLAIAVVLVVVAVAASIVLFAYLGYDETYRRDLIEKAVWKAMHEEAVRRLKKSGVIKTHEKLT
ncbi:MAG TPA: hypothetical protein VMC84_02575 [Methanocella sp.]|uniref:hypothetical protein n=1 Tax=Methanocella sp. TaxID=2052833 RepID=UPI002CDEAC4D|nr:hypothetical protein [Methanocella sp.]HTY90039.1 hypothetical protein [Methanocella sp.]